MVRRKKKPTHKKLSPRDELEALINKQPGISDIHRLFREMFITRNDRGAGILMSSYLEDALRTAITNNLNVRPKQQKALFGINGPLGTFANKIKIAYALDIIGPETFSNLDYIRLIRNAFAHSKVSISFKTKIVRDICALLKMPTDLSHFPFLPLDETARDIFSSVCYITAKNFEPGRNAFDSDISHFDIGHWELIYLPTGRRIPIKKGSNLLLKRQSLP